MSTLHRFIFENGRSIVACCEEDDLRRSSNARFGPECPVVTLVADGSVRTIPVNTLEAILPVESSFQVPQGSAVYRLALID